MLDQPVSGLNSVFTSLTATFSSATRTEVEHLRIKMRTEMEDLADIVDHRRDLLRNERDLFSSSQKLASSRDWVLEMRNGNIVADLVRLKPLSSRTVYRRRVPLSSGTAASSIIAGSLSKFVSKRILSYTSLRWNWKKNERQTLYNSRFNDNN